jgi:hypothetical protein
MAAKQSTKLLSKANKYAKELRKPQYRQLVIRNKKKYYNRNKNKNEIITELQSSRDD